jgi:Domain of unknown function (DUF397)
MEVTGVSWRKSSYSGINCVEVGSTGRVVAVHDSKIPHGYVLAFAPQAWGAFTGQVQEGAVRA